jgi:hypothetical protein
MPSVEERDQVTAHQYERFGPSSTFSVTLTWAEDPDKGAVGNVRTLFIKLEPAT